MVIEIVGGDVVVDCVVVGVVLVADGDGANYDDDVVIVFVYMCAGGVIGVVLLLMLCRWLS